VRPDDSLPAGVGKHSARLVQVLLTIPASGWACPNLRGECLQAHQAECEIGGVVFEQWVSRNRITAKCATLGARRRGNG